MTELFASSPWLVEEERFDRLLHALAQLPDSVRLQIAGEGPARAGLEVTARAYGLDERVDFTAGGNAASGATVVRPSRANLARSPAQRNDGSPARAIVFGGGGGDDVAGVGNMAELLEALSPGGSAATRRGDDEVLEGHRIALITNRPTHYRVPLWNQLTRRLEHAGARMRVLFTAPRRNDRPWMVLDEIAFDHRWLRSKRPGGRFDAPFDLERRLREFRPTLVVSGGFSPATSGRAVAYASRHDIPFGLWGGEVPWARTAESRFRRSHRAWTLGRTSFSLCYGSVSSDYVHSVAPSVPRVLVRNSSPLPAAGPPQAGDHREVRVLAVAQAIHRKGLDVAIDAVRNLDGDVRLIVAGGGLALNELRERARGADNIELLGPIASDEVAALYASADAFLFPTRFDVFGLVLVESLGAGLPTIVSDSAGATGDLVVNGKNGVRVEGHDPARWAEAIGALVEDPGGRSAMGAAARRTVTERWSIDHSVDAWAAGFRLGALTARSS